MTILSTSFSYPTHNRTKSLLAAISFCSRIESLATSWAFSLQQNLRSTFIGASDSAKYSFFAVKWRLKNLFTVWAFSLFDRFCSYTSSGYAATFNAAIHLIGITGARKKNIVAMETNSLFYFYSKPLFMVMGCMFISFKNFKIFNSIVSFYAIFVMNYFIRTKFSAKIFYHYISMFEHSVFVFCVKIMKFWFIVNIDNHIAVSTTKGSAAFPVWMIFPSSTHDGTPSYENIGYNT